jgi:hypothetical protein
VRRIRKKKFRFSLWARVPEEKKKKKEKRKKMGAGSSSGIERFDGRFKVHPHTPSSLDECVRFDETVEDGEYVVATDAMDDEASDALLEVARVAVSTVGDAYDGPDVDECSTIPDAIEARGARAVRILPPTPGAVASCIASGHVVLGGVEIIEAGELVGYSPCMLVSVHVKDRAIEKFGALVRTDEWEERDLSPEQLENAIGFFFART